jgi:chemotaxis protein methyltransferase CheR
MPPDECVPGLTHALAAGELSPRDAAELEALKRLIRERTGLHCDGYKERCLRRRIAVRMRARQAHRFADYARILEHDATEFRRLADTLTINVSKFFRNPEVWALVRERVVPYLFEVDAPVVDVWSAGAAAGEEAYTLAILLLEHAARYGGDVSRIRITGTDIDRSALAGAVRAEYPAFALTEMPGAVRERWFEGPERNRLRAEVRARVRFRTLDLITGAFPARQHFILCRNVVIYFEREVQRSIFSRFRDALVPGGWLLLGKVEALFGEALHDYQAVSNRERLFRRP